MNAGTHGLQSKPRWRSPRWVTAGAVLLLFATHSGLQAQDYAVQNWHVDEGLPDGDITAIQQTPDGFLWVGTPKGLARFDGMQFKVFNPDNTPGLTDPQISSLFTDSQGTLWIGTRDGNLLRRQAEGFESLHPPLCEPPGPGEKQRSGSWLWSRRIQLTEGIQNTERPTLPSLPPGLTDLVQDAEGAIWWRVSGRGLARLKAGQWTVLSATNTVPGGEIEQLTCDREGQVWILANGRLHHFHDERWDSPDKAVLLGGRWPVLLPARQHGLWVADPRGSWLQGGGHVRRLVDGQWHDELLPTIASPHATARSSPVAGDRTGRIWYGTSSGGLFFSHRADPWQRLNARGRFSQATFRACSRIARATFG